MPRSPAFPVLATVLVLTIPSAPSHAADEGPPSIRVQGQAELSAPPDFAEFSVQVISRSGDATDAAADNATRSAAVLKALRAGIGESGTLRTQSFSVAPQYRWADGEQTLVGYVAHNSIGVELEDLARIGNLTAAALDAGADSIANLQIRLKDDTALRAEALALASSRARAKANSIAQGLGLKVIRVLEVTEHGGAGVPRPLVRQAVQMEAASASAPPIAPGAIRITASVELRVEISD